MRLGQRNRHLLPCECHVVRTQIQAGRTVARDNNLQRLHWTKIVLFGKWKLCKPISAEVVDEQRDRVAILFASERIRAWLKAPRPKSERSLGKQDAAVFFLVRGAVSSSVDQTG